MRRLRFLPAGVATLAAIGASSLVAPRAALATLEDAATAAAPPARVEVVIVGPDAASAVLAAALTPLLSGDSRITWRRENGPPPAAADSGPPASALSGVWIETTPRGAVRIVAFTPDASPAVRVVDGGAPSLTAEIVAQIVRETAVALLDREAIRGPAVEAQSDAPRAAAVPNDQSPPLAPTPTAKATTLTRELREPIRFTYAAGLAYVSRRVFADNAFQRTIGQDHDFTEEGVGASLAMLTPAEPFGLSAGLLLDRATIATAAGGGNVSEPALDITRWSLRAMAGPFVRFQDSVEIGLAVGGGIDRIAAQAGATGGGWTWIPAARAALRLAVLFPPSGLEIAGAVTLDVKPRTLFTQGWADQGGYQIYGTTLLQPGISIGLGWRR